MCTAFVIFDNETGHETLAFSLERQLQRLVDNRQVQGTARWYYDEFAENGTEFGVRIDIYGSSEAQWLQLLLLVAAHCKLHYGDTVRVEVV